MATFIKCDVCGETKDPGEITGKFQFVKWSMFGKKGATPAGIQEDYCKDCVGDIIKAVEKVKKGKTEKK